MPLTDSGRRLRDDLKLSISNYFSAISIKRVEFYNDLCYNWLPVRHFN